VVGRDSRHRERGEKQAQRAVAIRYRVTKQATVQHPSGPEDVVTIAAHEFLLGTDRMLVPVLGAVMVVSCRTGWTMLTRVRKAGPLAASSPTK
jgi:ribosomal protein L32E